MEQRGIPDSVKRFVLANLHSVEQLAVLLFLRRYAESPWTATAVSQALRTNPASVATRLKDFRSRRLLARHSQGGEPSFQFDPAPDLVEVVRPLATFSAWMGGVWHHAVLCAGERRCSDRIPGLGRRGFAGVFWGFMWTGAREAGRSHRTALSCRIYLA